MNDETTPGSGAERHQQPECGACQLDAADDLQYGRRFRGVTAIRPRPHRYPPAPHPRRKTVVSSSVEWTVFLKTARIGGPRPSRRWRRRRRTINRVDRTFCEAAELAILTRHGCVPPAPVTSPATSHQPLATSYSYQFEGRTVMGTERKPARRRSRARQRALHPGRMRSLMGTSA